MRAFAAEAGRLGVILALIGGLLNPAAQGAANGGPVPDRIARADVNEPVRLMIQLQSAPLADERPPAPDKLRVEHASFRSRMATSGIQFREIREHQTLFNGITIEAKGTDLGRISGIPGVTGVFVVRKTQVPTPHLASSVGMIGAPKAWVGDPANSIPGVNGKGVRVAVIDTGIDYHHPDLGGCFGPGCRVVAGYDFVGDKFDGTNKPIPDADPMDQNGHGTHVSGIIGAKAASATGVTGVAPGVSFVALKVFGPDGYTWDDILLEALEVAYDMRVDVINMSVGSAFQWPQYPTAQAVERLANKGIVIATSAGNSGDAGEYSTGAPAVGGGAMAVASFENDSVQYKGFLTPSGKAIGYQTMELSPPAPTVGQSSELVHVGLGKSDADFLNPNGSSKVQGKVALISRGEVSFRDKSLLAKKHGALQAIIYNNQKGIFLGTLQTAGNYIPTVSITQGDGQHLLDLIGKGPVRVTWSNKLYLFPSPTAGLMSDFSSWGPAPDLTVKPDLTAPGGNIYSTFPLAKGGYATLSGTSMSSPHVAGAAALVLQGRAELAKKGWGRVKPTAIRTLLMNTAQPRTQGPDSKVLYPVHRQGAGMIDVWRAVTAKQRVLPEKIAFGEVSSGATLEQTIMVENLGQKSDTYRFAVVGGDGQPAVMMAAGVEPLEVKAGQTRNAKVSLTVPSTLANGGIFTGWIAVINGAGETVAHIPYLGFKGDYQAASALEPTFLGLPWLARLEGPWLYKSTAVEIHPGCDCDAGAAWIIYSLARQPRELKLEIWEPATGRKWGNAFSAQYLGRSAGALEIFTWDGTNDKGRQVEAGTYVLRLMALRPLGDPSNPAHWDIWTSGTVKVVYD